MSEPYIATNKQQVANKEKIWGLKNLPKLLEDDKLKLCALNAQLVSHRRRHTKECARGELSSSMAAVGEQSHVRCVYSCPWLNRDKAI